MKKVVSGVILTFSIASFVFSAQQRPVTHLLRLAKNHLTFPSPIKIKEEKDGKTTVILNPDFKKAGVALGLTSLTSPSHFYRPTPRQSLLNPNTFPTQSLPRVPSLFKCIVRPSSAGSDSSESQSSFTSTEKISYSPTLNFSTNPQSLPIDSSFSPLERERELMTLEALENEEIQELLQRLKVSSSDTENSLVNSDREDTPPVNSISTVVQSE